MENGPKDTDELYQMLCSLSDESRQKAVSYLSFLRFVDVYKDKDMGKLLKAELTKMQELAAPDVVDPEVPSVESAYWESVPHYEPEVRATDVASEREPFEAGSSFAEPFFTEPPFAEPSFADSSLATPPLAESAADAPTPGGSAYLDDPDQFFMPVRSERFELLEKTVAEKPVFSYRDAPPEPLPEPEREEPVRSEWIEWAEPFEEPLVAAKTEAREQPIEIVQTLPKPPGPRLKRAMKILRLDLAAAAFVFDISLSTLYDWFGDIPLEGEQEEQLQYLAEVADRVEALDIPRLDLLVRAPFADGEIFAQKLKARTVRDEDLNFLRDAAERSAELRRKFKGAAKPFFAFQETVALYATPLYSEAR